MGALYSHNKIGWLSLVSCKVAESSKQLWDTWQRPSITGKTFDAGMFEVVPPRSRFLFHELVWISLRRISYLIQLHVSQMEMHHELHLLHWHLQSFVDFSRVCSSLKIGLSASTRNCGKLITVLLIMWCGPPFHAAEILRVTILARAEIFSTQCLRRDSHRLLDRMLESRESPGSPIGVWRERSQMKFQGHAEGRTGMNQRGVVQDQHPVQISVAYRHVWMQQRLRKQCSLSELRTGAWAVWEAIFWGGKTFFKSERSLYLYPNPYWIPRAELRESMFLFFSQFRIQTIVNIWNNWTESELCWGPDSV